MEVVGHPSKFFQEKEDCECFTAKEVANNKGKTEDAEREERMSRTRAKTGTKKNGVGLALLGRVLFFSSTVESIRKEVCFPGGSDGKESHNS